MTTRELPWISLRTASGVCALYLSLHGVWNIYGLDFRIDTLISVLYCLLPFLSFFVFLFARQAKIELSLHILIAFGYFAAYVFLNWRTCSAFGYCTTVGSTIGTTLETKPVLAAFAVILFTGVAQWFDGRSAAKSQSRPAT